MNEDKPALLAVDDDDMNLMVLGRVLGKDFAVHEETSGREALAWLAQNQCALILLDYRMPGMDGLEVLKVLKADERTRKIPVIMLTGDMDVETDGFRAGADDFIHKPFMPEAVMLRVKKLLNYEYLKAHLEDEVRRQTRIAEERRATSDRLFEETVLALAKAIDAKDRYTRGHSQRVAEYARRISRMAGDDEKTQREIYQMGLLHDVGKIGVPGAIINKPSRLTDEEYEIIKSHTVTGAEILSLIREFPELVIGARSHHERYDGRGYPDGIAGENIPRAARIIAVADTYDAMTSRRSYRNILPQAVVREEIAKGRGSQFDPKFADLMLKMIDADKNYDMRDK